MVGKERRTFRKADLPIFLKNFPNFGDLRIDPEELDKYGFIGYIPNTDLMDSGFDYGGMFIVKDQLCDGTQWHKRDNPSQPATEPYFPINQVALSTRAQRGNLIVGLKTFTPNFKEFQVKHDNTAWEPCGDEFTWTLKPGTNLFEARAVNSFGVTGRPSRLEVHQR